MTDFRYAAAPDWKAAGIAFGLEIGAAYSSTMSNCSCA